MTLDAIERLDRGTALIAELMRTRWTPLDQQRFDRALAQCDVPSWRLAVRFHGVAGLLGHHHGELVETVLPEDYQAVLKQQHDLLRMKALGQAGVMKGLLQTMQDAGVPVMPLKGVTLSAQLYDDFAVRLAGDLDVLVDAQDLDQALDVLAKAEWQREPDYDLSDPVLRRRALGYLRHVRVTNQAGDILELHWRTTATKQRSLPPLQDFADAGRVGASHGLTFPQMPDDLLVMLIAHHSASAMVGRFKWGFDLIDLVARQPVATPVSSAVGRSINAVAAIMAAQLRVEQHASMPSGVPVSYLLTRRLAQTAHVWERGRLATRGMASGARLLDLIRGRLLRTAYYACLHGPVGWLGYLGVELGRWLFTDAPAGKPVKSVWASITGRLARLRGA